MNTNNNNPATLIRSQEQIDLYYNNVKEAKKQEAKIQAVLAVVFLAVVGTLCAVLFTFGHIN